MDKVHDEGAMDSAEMRDEFLMDTDFDLMIVDTLSDGENARWCQPQYTDAFILKKRAAKTTFELVVVCIDWYGQICLLKVLKGTSRFQRIKFIYDWQPTNSQKL